MSSYDSYESQSKFGLYVFLACILAAGIFFTRKGEKEGVADSAARPGQSEVVKKEEVGETPDAIDPFSADFAEMVEPVNPIVPATPEQILKDAGMGTAELEPEVLLKKIGQSLEEFDLKQLTMLIGKNALNESQLKGLQALSEQGDYRLSSQNPFEEIGELEANHRARWAVNLESAKAGETTENASIYFDLVRGEDGNWAIGQLKIPALGLDTNSASRADFADSLGITYAFLQSALEQDFDDAKSFVDSEKVSDAKIAGLCIIFEEAKYKLRDKKPLRAMFNRDLTAGFIAHVEDESGEKAADFGMTLERSGVDQPWRLIEVNLDSLLADYADRVAGGDVYFTPLVKNPAGGDTLILYFGFDEDNLTPRTQRQLDIVAGLLKLDPGKKLTLSGHTDALGSDKYNDSLSGNRAGAVKKYLLGIGVPLTQIEAVAEGSSKPRRPNSTESGEDDPSGRRANRRTEIYLDF